MLRRRSIPSSIGGRRRSTRRRALQTRRQPSTTPSTTSHASHLRPPGVHDRVLRMSNTPRPMVVEAPRPHRHQQSHTLLIHPSKLTALPRDYVVPSYKPKPSQFAGYRVAARSSWIAISEWPGDGGTGHVGPPWAGIRAPCGGLRRWTEPHVPEPVIGDSI